MTDGKCWYCSKTVWLGAAVAILPAIQWATGQEIIAANPIASLIVGALVVTLRAFTDKPLTK